MYVPTIVPLSASNGGYSSIYSDTDSIIFTTYSDLDTTTTPTTTGSLGSSADEDYAGRLMMKPYDSDWLPTHQRRRRSRAGEKNKKHSLPSPHFRRRKVELWLKRNRKYFTPSTPAPTPKSVYVPSPEPEYVPSTPPPHVYMDIDIDSDATWDNDVNPSPTAYDIFNFDTHCREIMDEVNPGCI